MKKILTTLLALLALTLTLHAQTKPDVLMKIYVKGNTTATVGDGDETINLHGVLTLPANAFDSIVYVLKDIDGLNFVDLGTGDGAQWATINYGATEDNIIGERLPWARLDEVSQNWGTPYRRYVQAPTIEQLTNLRNNCNWEQVTENGVLKGFNVYKRLADDTSDPNTFIFLPVTGYLDPETGTDINKSQRGYYWSSSEQEGYDQEARALVFGIEDVKGDIGRNNRHYRTYSYAVRPVRTTEPPIRAYVDKVEATYAAGKVTFTIEVHVDEGAEQGDYGVDYRLLGTDSWTTATHGVRSVAITAPAPGIYEYRGYALVKGLTRPTYSHTSDYPTFEVPEVTATVNSVRFIEYKNRVARFSITAGVEGDGTLGSYGVEYRLQPNGKWQSQEHTAANTVEVSGLTPGTYDYRGYATLQGSTERVFSPAGNYDTFEVQPNTLTLHAAVVEGSLKYNSVTIRVWPEADDITAFQLGSWGIYFDETENNVKNPNSFVSPKPGEGTLSATGSTMQIPLDPEHTYYYRAYAIVDGQGMAGDATQSVTSPVKPDFIEPDAIDLGLPSGTKWASFNLGAENEFDNGKYYGWGDSTGTVIELGPGFYATDVNGPADISSDSLAKYDIVHVKLQGNWHMPDTTQLRELIENCYFRSERNYQNVTDLNGFVVTGPNGNTIFIPAASYATAYNQEWYPRTESDAGAYYWSSILDADQSAYYARFVQGHGTGLIKKNLKSMGFLIRPVIPGSGSQQPSETENPREPKDQKASDGSLIPKAGVDMGMRTVSWACWNLGATDTIGTNSIGKYYAWGETEGKDRYINDTYNNGYGTELGTSINNGTGIVDDEHDAATKLWSDGWRMPTQDEINQLISECSWSFAKENGVEGIRFTDDNKSGYHNKATNNSIFFPFAPYRDDEISNESFSNESLCGYWTSTRWDDGDLTQKQNYATYLQMQKQVDSDFNTFIKDIGLKGFWRFAGMLIRPVKDLPASTRKSREAFHREMESRRASQAE